MSKGKGVNEGKLSRKGSEVSGCLYLWKSLVDLTCLNKGKGKRELIRGKNGKLDLVVRETGTVMTSLDK